MVPDKKKKLFNKINEEFEKLFGHPLVRIMGNRPSHKQLSLIKAAAMEKSPCERNGSTTAPSCMSAAKYCVSSVALSLVV